MENKIKIITSKLLKTYDAKILNDVTDINIKSAFYSLSKHYRKENVLFKLIYNYFTKKDIQLPRYIAGPYHLTKHIKNLDNNLPLTIYTFGEIHKTYTDCPDEDNQRKIIPNDMESTDKNDKNVLSITKYLDKLIQNTNCFLDIYIETPHLVQGTYKYKSFTDDYQLYILTKYFKQCIELPTRKLVEKCNTARFHYIDIRNIEDINNKLFSFLKITRAFFIDLQDANDSGYLINDDMYIFIQENKQNLNDMLSIIYNKSNTKSNTKSNINSNNYKNLYLFLVNQLTENKIVKKELEKSYMKKEITNFINNKFKQEIENLAPILDSQKNILNYMENLDDIDDTFYDNLYKIYLVMTISESYIMDAYTLSRIFKQFNVTDKQQPEKPYNILIYAGDEHCQRYREFFDSIKSKQVEESGIFRKTDEYSNCLDMRKIKQPIFN